MRAFRTARARFTGWFLAVLTLLLVAMSVGTFFYLRHTLYAGLDEALVRRAEELFRQTNLEPELRSGRFDPPLGELVALFVPGEDGFTAISTRPLQGAVEASWIESAAQGRRPSSPCTQGPSSRSGSM
jgi:hypothetical protein